MNRKLVILGAFFIAGVAGFAAYRAAGAIVQSEGQTKHSMDRMRSLTVTDHARLKAGLNSFRDMSQADQDRLRSIHDALEGPQSDSQLRRIANNYYRWYKSLGPGSRADLRDEPDVAAKLELVQKLHEKTLKAQRRKGEAPVSRGGERYVLNSEDLAAVMQVLKEKLDEKGSFTSELKELEELEGIWRYNGVMMIIKQQLGPRRGRGQKSERWLREFFRDKRLLKAVSDEKIRKDLTRKIRPPRDKNHRPSPQAVRWFGLIVRSMKVEYDHEIKEIRPSHEELFSYFATLDSDVQDDLIGLPQKKFMRILENRLMESHPKRFPANPRREFMPWRSRGFREGMRRPAPRGGRPRQERPPERGPA